MGQAVHCRYHPENEAPTSHLPKLQPTSLAEGIKYRRSTCIFYGADYTMINIYKSNTLPTIQLRNNTPEMEFQSSFLCIHAGQYLLMESMTLLEPSRSAGDLADMSAGPGRSLQTDLINQPSATGHSNKMAGGSAGAEMAI